LLRSRTIPICALLLLPLYCSAQQNKLIVAPPAPLTAKRGSTVTQDLKVSVLPGFHVNSDKPKDEYLIPLKLTWPDGPLETKSISYPKSEAIKVGSQDLVVFTGSFEIQTQFKVPENAPPGAITVTGKLRYQACNNEMCFRPASAEVKLSVSIE
jgi:thioredoxin:protein disulfide reductase